jgi:hypothetical protein
VTGPSPIEDAVNTWSAEDGVASAAAMPADPAKRPPAAIAITAHLAVTELRRAFPVRRGDPVRFIGMYMNPHFRDFRGWRAAFRPAVAWVWCWTGWPGTALPCGVGQAAGGQPGDPLLAGGQPASRCRAAAAAHNPVAGS